MGEQNFGGDGRAYARTLIIDFFFKFVKYFVYILFLFTAFHNLRFIILFAEFIYFILLRQVEHIF